MIKSVHSAFAMLVVCTRFWLIGVIRSAISLNRLNRGNYGRVCTTIVDDKKALERRLKGKEK